MKKTLIAMATLISASGLMACEFTSLNVKVKVESRTVSYESHKEKIKTVGKLRGTFMKNSTGSYKVFQSKDLEIPITGLSFTERYDDYVSSIRTNIGLTGEALAHIISEAVGERKMERHPELKAYVDSIQGNKAIALQSYFYKFSGYSYGEVDDETADSLTISDHSNPDNELRVSFNFKRYLSCH